MAFRRNTARHFTPKNDVEGEQALEQATPSDAMGEIRANVERDYARIYTAHIF